MDFDLLLVHGQVIKFDNCIIPLFSLIKDLEEALLESEKEGGCEFLNDLVCKLLNGCYGRDDIW